MRLTVVDYIMFFSVASFYVRFDVNNSQLDSPRRHILLNEQLLMFLFALRNRIFGSDFSRCWPNFFVLSNENHRH